MTLKQTARRKPEDVIFFAANLVILTLNWLELFTPMRFFPWLPILNYSVLFVSIYKLDSFRHILGRSESLVLDPKLKRLLIPVQCIVVTGVTDFSIFLVLRHSWKGISVTDLLALFPILSVIIIFSFVLRFWGFPKFDDKKVEKRYQEGLATHFLTSMVLGFGGDIFISTFVFLTQLWVLGSKKPLEVGKRIWEAPLILAKRRSLLIGGAYILPVIVGVFNLRLVEPGNISQISLILASFAPLIFAYVATEFPKQEKRIFMASISIWTAFSLVVLLHPSMLPLTNHITDVFSEGSPATKLSFTIPFLGMLWAGLVAGTLAMYIDFDANIERALLLDFCAGSALFSLMLLTTEFFLLEIPFAQIDQASKFSFGMRGTGWAFAARTTRELIPRNASVLILLGGIYATYTFLTGHKKLSKLRRSNGRFLLKQVLLLCIVSSVLVIVDRPFLTYFQTEYYAKVALGYEEDYALMEIVDIHNWTRFCANITSSEIVEVRLGEVRLGMDPDLSSPTAKCVLNQSQNSFCFQNLSFKDCWADFQFLSDLKPDDPCVRVEIFRGRPSLVEFGYLSLAPLVNTVLSVPSFLLMLASKKGKLIPMLKAKFHARQRRKTVKKESSA